MVRPLGIGARLRLLALASAAPLIVFAVALVLWNSDTREQLLREQAARIAGAAMQAVDREVAGAIAGMQVLAASPALGSGELRAFDEQARAAVRVDGTSMITLYTRDGTRIISTAVPYGRGPAQHEDMTGIGAPFVTRRPQVSPLFTSAAMGRPTLGISVPVIVDDQVRYVLVASVLTDRLSGILSRSGVPPQWIATVLDQQGTIIGRTLNSGEMVGRKATRENWERIVGSTSDIGAFKGPTQEGERALLTFERSATSGWTTVIGIPQVLLASGLQRSLAAVAGAGAAMLLLAWLLALWAAKHISAPLEQLERSARCLQEGKVVETAPTGVEQFDRVAQAMADAGERIKEREARITENLAALRHAHEQLRNEQTQKDQFIATLAHELRNPLAPLRTGVHVLARSPTPAVGERTLAMMGRQLTHMVRLIDDLLDVSRVARGKLQLRKEHVVLQQLIAHALDASTPMITAGRHQFTVHVPPAPIELEADPTRISQVITNILNNAAKFTPPGGTISLAASSDGREAQVRIADNGIGIPPERLEHVFQLFSQLKEGAQTGPPGLGIGLALARMLVEMHHGTIEAHSAGRGQGATFVVRLPVAGPRASSAPARAPAREPAARPLAILLADDNRDAAEVLATALRLAGHEVLVAHDGPAALALAEANEADVALLDIGMPGMNGYELCRRLRELPGYAHARIVALTGWGAASDREQARQAGFDEHLTKPVDWMRLEEVIGSSYDGARKGEAT